jgi:hypothetical protein
MSGVRSASNQSSSAELIRQPSFLPQSIASFSVQGRFKSLSTLMFDGSDSSL